MEKSQAHETLLDAARTGRTEDAKAAIDAGADVNQIGLTPLHWAAKFGHTDIAKLLIEHGADVNAREGFGQTPLHLMAAYSGNRNIAQLLIEKGADVNAKNKLGQTPLQIAEEAFREDISNILTEAMEKQSGHTGRIESQRSKSGAPEVGG